MKNYTITKEQILQLSDFDEIVKELLKEGFPDAFKKELEVGKWYIVNGDKCGHGGKNLIANYSGIESDSNYGLRFSGEWDNELSIFHKDLVSISREATPAEVEAALIAEAKKRGYKGGIKLFPLEHCASEIDIEKQDVYKFYPNVSDKIRERLELNGTGIYQDGKWAEILPEEKAYTFTEAELTDVFNTVFDADRQRIEALEYLKVFLQKMESIKQKF